MASLNRYQRGDLIGKGGMGTVYRGLDTETGQPVALKFILPDLAATNPEAVERFRREGEALRQLDHPNIVKILDMGEISGEQCIVTELVTGGSLADLIKSSAPLPVEQTLKIALELADALTRAHHLNIIHRDIKPDNILLAEDGTPRLTDFGLARLTQSVSLTDERMIVGTLPYLSPEAINNEVLDEGTDIWAFGVTLFKMLTGIQPFRGETIGAICQSILRDAPDPDLEILRPDIPLSLTDLIYRMLEKDRRLRIPTVRLVGAELWGILRGVDLSLYSRNTPIEEDTFSFLQHEPAAKRPKHNLPKQSTPFIGREDELAMLNSLLGDPNIRLVSIVGQGGMGKTRLALQMAETMLDKVANGVYFVPFAGIDSPQFMVSTIMDALAIPRMGMRQHSQYASSEREDRQLLNYLREKQIVLVMDNLEQLLDGVNLLTEMLEAAPQLKILTTTRERLNVRDEKVFWLAGLATPASTTSQQSIEDFSAVQLFLERARIIRPDFETMPTDEKAIVQICMLVVGMPLGIELAAAWLELLSPQEIATEISKSLDFLESDLRDLPDRHRSMRALFESTWGRLSDDEQDVMMCMSVFRGGFTQHAATAVTGTSLKTLRALSNKSLLRRDELGRYDIHELLRQFAAERLADDATLDLAARDRHSAYILEFAVDCWHDFMNGYQKPALSDLETELENISGAWAWAVYRNDAEKLMQAIEAIGRYYSLKSMISEPEHIFRYTADHFESRTTKQEETLFGCSLMWLSESILDTAESWSTYWRGVEILRRHDARAALIRSPMLWSEHDAADRLILVQERLKIAEELNDSYHVGTFLCELGLYYRNEFGDYKSAVKYFNESLTIQRTINDQYGIAINLLQLGIIEAINQNYEKAVQHQSDSLEMFRLLDVKLGITWCINNLALIAAELGDYRNAKLEFENLLEAAREESNGLNIFNAFDGLGTVAYLQEDFETARTYYAESALIADSLRMIWAQSFIQKQQGFVETAVGNYRVARALYYKVLDKLEEIGTQFQILIDLAIGTALIAAATGLTERALELLYFTAQRPVMDKHVQDEQRLLAELEAELPADVVAAAKKRAEQLTLDDVIAMLWEELGTDE